MKNRSPNKNTWESGEIFPMMDSAEGDRGQIGRKSTVQNNKEEKLKDFEKKATDRNFSGLLAGRRS